MCPVTSRDRSVAVERRIDRVEATTPAEAMTRTKTHRRPPRQLVIVAAGGCVVALIAIGYVSRNAWLPQARQLMAAAQQRIHGDEGDAHATDDALGAVDPHAGHDHAAAAPNEAEATSMQLSEQGRKNVGLRLMTIELQAFDRTISVPAMVQQRPGRTELKVAAPMTGVVTRVYPIRGEAVRPGQRLFDLRLTHEDLVNTQSGFLEIVEQLDVIKREVARLEEVTSSGAIAGKRLLERQYEQQQAEARLRAQQQALILHGLTQQQVDEIETTRRLLQRVTVFAPQPAEAPSSAANPSPLQVSEIAVALGEHVTAGTLLCVIADHAMLYIEGRSFEEDSSELNDAASAGAPVTAIIKANGNGPHTVTGLKILYVENQVDPTSRALRFYVRLPNELVRDQPTQDGHRFVSWRFKPGQRVQLRVPVEQWEDRIVLPIDAVVQEGVDWFVFQQNGDHFDRKPVHVEYRDQRWVVIAPDGTLFPGDIVVASGAYQMHLAMKNKAGGGVDPHAGHGH